jgi:hypothetical protein
MEDLGQARTSLVAAEPIAFAGSALLLAAGLAALAWPFAIDDAWIPVRYARHLREGAGYVWNVGGPSTDGVTPLPWAAVLLYPLARGTPLAVLTRAKLAGALVWSVTAATFGYRLGVLRVPRWIKVVPLLVLAVNLPVAAHSVSGLETSFAMSLATLAALSYRRPVLAAILAGLSATLRPELVVWGVVLASGFALLEPPPRRPLRPLLLGIIAFLPFTLCALLRLVLFGAAAPLSILAKPADLSQGLAYAGAALIFSVAPLTLAAPLALMRERGPALVVALAGAAHAVVVVLVGGDWMPYARLVAPIVPSLLLAFVLLASSVHSRAHAWRAALAVVLGSFFFLKNVGRLRDAGEARARLIEEARPVLASARVIAAVDIGWVSAVSEGTIVDLAGVTDPEVASLGGSHTSKRIDPALLRARGVDTVVMYSDPLEVRLVDVRAYDFTRVVEARLFSSPAFTARYAPSALLSLGADRTGYVVFTSRDLPPDERVLSP